MRHSMLTSSKGRVLYDLFVYTDASPDGRPRYLIEYDSRTSDGPSLHDLLKRYVLRAKVKIRDVSQDYDVWAAWGSQDTSVSSAPQWTFAPSGAIEPVWVNASEIWPWGSEDRIITDRRASGMGSRMLVSKGDSRKFTSLQF